MALTANSTEVFEACSTRIAYEALANQPVGRSMQALYQELRRGLKELYLSSDDLVRSFEDWQNKKRC